MTLPFDFHFKIRVRFNETDLQGHVNFAQYLNYFDLAIVEYMRSLNYDYKKMLAEGIDMLYIDAHTTYHSPAQFDEMIMLHCQIGHVGNTSLRYDIQIFSDSDDRLIATGEISAVTAERGTWKKLRVPDSIRNAAVKELDKV